MKNGRRKCCDQVSWCPTLCDLEAKKPRLPPFARSENMARMISLQPLTTWLLFGVEQKPPEGDICSLNLLFLWVCDTRQARTEFRAGRSFWRASKELHSIHCYRRRWLDLGIATLEILHDLCIFDIDLIYITCILMMCIRYNSRFDMFDVIWYNIVYVCMYICILYIMIVWVCVCVCTLLGNGVNPGPGVWTGHFVDHPQQESASMFFLKFGGAISSALTSLWKIYENTPFIDDWHIEQTSYFP